MALDIVTGFLAGATGMFLGLARTLLDVNPLVLLTGLIFVVIIVFYIMKTIMKIAIVGLFSALLVLVAYFLGLPVPVTIQTLIATAIFGIIIYAILRYLEIMFKALRLALSPLRKFAKRKKEE